VSDQGGDVAQDLLLEVRVLDHREVGKLLGAEQQAHAGRAPAAEQPGDPVRRDGAELVDQDQGGQRLVLVVGSDSQEVLDDRGGDHRGQQRPAVRVQAEVDDLAGLDGSQQVDPGPAGVVRL
jgi:hypothetical protein